MKVEVVRGLWHTAEGVVTEVTESSTSTGIKTKKCYNVKCVSRKVKTMSEKDDQEDATQAASLVECCRS